MYSICFETEGSSSGRRLHVQLMAQLQHNCKYNLLPEDEPSGSKHVEDVVNFKIKIKILV